MALDPRLAIGLAGIAAAAAARGGRAPARIGEAAAQGLAGFGALQLERAAAREAAQAKLDEERRAEARDRRVFLFQDEYKAARSREAAARVVPQMHAAVLASDPEMIDIIGAEPPPDLTMEDAKALYDSAKTYAQAKADKLKATDMHDKDIADRTVDAARTRTEELRARTDAAREVRMRGEAATSAKMRKLETAIKIVNAVAPRPTGRTALPVGGAPSPRASLEITGKVLTSTNGIVNRIFEKTAAGATADETDPIARSLVNWDTDWPSADDVPAEDVVNTRTVWPLLDYAAALEGGDAAEIETAATNAAKTTGMNVSGFRAAYEEFARSHPLAADFESYGATVVAGRRGLAPAGMPSAAPGVSEVERKRLLMSLLGDDPELVEALREMEAAGPAPVAPFAQDARSLADAERLGGASLIDSLVPGF